MVFTLHNKRTCWYGFYWMIYENSEHRCVAECGYWQQKEFKMKVFNVGRLWFFTWLIGLLTFCLLDCVLGTSIALSQDQILLLADLFCLQQERSVSEYTLERRAASQSHYLAKTRRGLRKQRGAVLKTYFKISLKCSAQVLHGYNREIIAIYNAVPHNQIFNVLEQKVHRHTKLPFVYIPQLLKHKKNIACENNTGQNWRQNTSRASCSPVL